MKIGSGVGALPGSSHNIKSRLNPLDLSGFSVSGTGKVLLLLNNDLR